MGASGLTRSLTISPFLIYERPEEPMLFIDVDIDETGRYVFFQTRRSVSWVRSLSVAWTKDGRGFFYGRYPEPRPGKALEDALRDGRHFAFGQSQGGSDWSTYYVRELGTGKELPEVIRSGAAIAGAIGPPCRAARRSRRSASPAKPSQGGSEEHHERREHG